MKLLKVPEKSFCHPFQNQVGKDSQLYWHKLCACSVSDFGSQKRANPVKHAAVFRHVKPESDRPYSLPSPKRESSSTDCTDSGFSTEDSPSREKQGPPRLDKITELTYENSYANEQEPPVLDSMNIVEDGAECAYGKPSSACSMPFYKSNSSSVPLESVEPYEDEDSDSDSDSENNPAHCFSARTFWTPAYWKEAKKSVDILRWNFEGFESACSSEVDKKCSDTSTSHIDSRAQLEDNVDHSSSKERNWWSTTASTEEQTVTEYLVQRGVRVVRRQGQPQGEDRE